MIIMGQQLAHQEEIEELGPADLESALTAFRAIPWEEQQRQAKELQLCGPSFFLFDREPGAELLDDTSGDTFFAGLLETDKVEFILSLDRPEECEGWAPFGKRRKQRIQNFVSYDHDRSAVEQAIGCFFADRSSLIKLIQGGNNYS